MRERLLLNIYRELFRSKKFNYELAHAWAYVYECIANEREEEIPTNVLEMVNQWIAER